MMATPRNIWYSALIALASSLLYLSWGFKCNQLFDDLPRLKFLDQGNKTIQYHGQRFYHDDYEKYLNVFVIHHSLTGNYYM